MVLIKKTNFKIGKLKRKNNLLKVNKTRSAFFKNKKAAVTRKSRSVAFFKNKKAFGGAASTMIMFIAVISVTTGLVIAFANYTETTQRSFDKQNELTSNKLRTSISITNVYYNSSSSKLYVYVKNIGETRLDANSLDLFVNNVFTNEFDVVYASDLTKNITLVQTQETLAIIRDTTLGAGTHEIEVVTQFGVGDKEYFNI